MLLRAFPLCSSFSVASLLYLSLGAHFDTDILLSHHSSCRCEITARGGGGLCFVVLFPACFPNVLCCLSFSIASRLFVPLSLCAHFFPHALSSSSPFRYLTLREITGKTGRCFVVPCERFVRVCSSFSIVFVFYLCFSVPTSTHTLFSHHSSSLSLCRCEITAKRDGCRCFVVRL